MTTISEDDELNDLWFRHLRYGVRVHLDRETVPGLPDGWGIITRHWGYRSWDALIRPPAPKVGWSLSGGRARSRRKAIKRAIAEIRVHLARPAPESAGRLEPKCTACGR